MRKLTSVVLAAACGALPCCSPPSSGRLAREAGAAAAPGLARGPEAPGVAASPFANAGGARTVRMPARVALDETRVYRVNAGVSGSIRDARPVVSGSRVRKGEVLGSFYAPETSTAVQLFLVHLIGYDPVTSQRRIPAALDASRAGSSVFQANMSRRTAELEDMGVSARQRAEIARVGLLPDAIEIVAPADGVVLSRNLSRGLKFERGHELFRIADLSRLWVVADVFPQDVRDIRSGLAAVVAVPELDVALPATIDRVLPEVDPVTRTTKVRLEVENPGRVLLPGMFAEVRVDVGVPPEPPPSRSAVREGTSARQSRAPAYGAVPGIPALDGQSARPSPSASGAGSRVDTALAPAGPGGARGRT